MQFCNDWMSGSGDDGSTFGANFNCDITGCYQSQTGCWTRLASSIPDNCQYQPAPCNVDGGFNLYCFQQ